ncbi:hypothetical protein FPSE_12156 [Fusarium pseudograminearum CS3096]|uniref:Uncharacterized protein n=1 Tax=Fusarium pseudograminearum (strain CS3096) TaxID=1028729 RepID=K3V464_FUSPC|nr:hypothetical protein FPSE_12156 [Fusarium pseudograminearum CS3096]EKJ67639.1 hypothetical protein FPSE_12156 [Fusarium pseudograminearum CS3096]
MMQGEITLVSRSDSDRISSHLSQRQIPRTAVLLFSSYLTRIPYLEAVIEETLRYGGATTALQHLSKVDTQILRYDIPKKMDVLFLAHGPIVFTPGFEIDESKRSQTYQAAGEKKGQAWDDQEIGAFKPERWLG